LRWLSLWDGEFAGRTFDLAAKIAVILAAIAAINLLGAKPHLTAKTTCVVTMNAHAIKARYRTVRRPATGTTRCSTTGPGAGTANPARSRRPG